MSSRDGEAVPAAAVPPWLDQATLRAMEQARERAFAWGRDALGAREAVQDILLAVCPALPFTMVAEAVAVVVPDAEGLTHAPGRGLEGGEELAAATRQEVAETLSYALRCQSASKRDPGSACKRDPLLVCLDAPGLAGAEP